MVMSYQLYHAYCKRLHISTVEFQLTVGVKLSEFSQVIAELSREVFAGVLEVARS